MNASTWAQVKDIFSHVVGLDAVEQRAFLDENCNGDAGLRQEVEALLRSNNEAENFIEEPAFTVADALPADPEPTIDKVIGHYRIVREIGRGGMGTVFLAKRDDGEFQQEVAIKVVSSAFLGRESLDRFRQERQILAGLTHPNIARLLDGGVTDDGLPYLVMEYVEGESLIDHAEAQNLSIDERLRVFLKICRAFAYAHANLIVHRDIKPSNIFVTPDGEPKLLDFGLAKITDIENDNLRTATTFRALTPAYASPEQLSGEPITTASDIYSLGVVLYELLTGSRPFNSESVPFEKMIQIVSTLEPEKPSMKVLQTSKVGGDNRLAAKRRQSLKGDIDNIVLMAMRKEPERRYRSVEQLAEDIDRHLSGLPIAASEDTFGYRTSKFVKRHWIGVTSVAVIGLILIAGIIATTVQTRGAQRAQARSETIGGFLQSILSSAAPEAKGADVKVKDILDDASERAKSEFENDPEVLARVLTTLGRTYVGLTLNEQAEKELRAAVAASERANGENHPVTAEGLAWLGIALGFQGKSTEGVQVSNRAIAIARIVHPNGHVDLGYALFGLSLNLLQNGDASGALPPAVEASLIIRQFLGEKHGYYLATLNELGLVHESLGNTDEAEKFFRETLTLGDGLDHRYRIYLAQAATYLGSLLIKKGDFAEAESQLANSENLYRDILGVSNTSMAVVKQLQGRLYIQLGRFDLAAEKLRDSLMVFSALLPPESGPLLNSKIRLGLALTRAGKLDEGERHLREAQVVAARSLPASSPIRAEIESSLAECMTRMGRR